MINRLTVVGRTKFTAVATVYIYVSLIQPLWTVSDMVDRGSDLSADLFQPAAVLLTDPSQAIVPINHTRPPPHCDEF